ncbi:MAG TPA: hypothetical protein PLH37_01675 [bacterium]|nr:hypothetical protein [bacterium]
MLKNSLDLLYIIIAFCVLWLTIFTSWWLFYIIMIMRRAYQITNSIKKKLKTLDELTKSAKDKLENTVLYINLAAEGISKIVGYFKNEKNGTESTAPKNKQKSKK